MCCHAKDGCSRSNSTKLQLDTQRHALMQKLNLTIIHTCRSTGASVSCEARLTGAFKATFSVAALSIPTADSVSSALIYIYTNRQCNRIVLQIHKHMHSRAMDGHSIQCIVCVYLCTVHVWSNGTIWNGINMFGL